MLAKKFQVIFPHCINCASNAKSIQIFSLPVRGLRYNKKGGLIGGRRRRLPFNWRDLNFNPARIPSAWKPKDWDQRQIIDYEYEAEVAKYIPGYAPKIPEYREKDYHESPIYTVDYQSKLSEGLKQALFLTKSVITEIGLPSRIVGLAESTTTAEQDDLAIQVFRHGNLFDVDPAVIPKYKSHFGQRLHKFDNFLIFPPVSRSCPLIVQELIRLCQTRTFQLSEEFHKRLIVQNVKSTACFERDHLKNLAKTTRRPFLTGLQFSFLVLFDCTGFLSKKYECPTMIPPGSADFLNKWQFRLTSKPDLQLQSQTPMPAFAGEDEVRNTKNVSLASLYPTTPIIDVQKTNRYDYANKTGIAVNSSQQHLHTMVLFNIEELKPNLLYSTMLTQLFSALYSKAVEMYGPTPQDLPKPIAAQCLASDGRLFQFMCLQLNTTKLDSDDGIKNMVWVDNDQINEELYNVDDTMTPFSMYSECSHTTWRSSDYYLDYNPEVFKLMQGFWLNGAL